MKGRTELVFHHHSCVDDDLVVYRVNVKFVYSLPTGLYSFPFLWISLMATALTAISNAIRIKLIRVLPTVAILHINSLTVEIATTKHKRTASSFTRLWVSRGPPNKLCYKLNKYFYADIFTCTFRIFVIYSFQQSLHRTIVEIRRFRNLPIINIFYQSWPVATFFFSLTYGLFVSGRVHELMSSIVSCTARNFVQL
jgi:hypothetical protein